MAWNISSWAIRRPLISMVLFLVLLCLGFRGWQQLPIQAMPSIIVPLIQVTIAQPGASPSDIEEQVTRRAEAVLGALDGIKKITSLVSPGLSVTEVEFHLNVPTDRAANDVRDALSRIRALLPAGIHDPVVEREDISGSSILTVAVSGKGQTEADLSWFIDDVVSRDLRRVRGVATVRREGGVNRQLCINLEPSRLLALDVSADVVDDAVHAELETLPGGHVVLPNHDLPIRVQGGSAITSTQSLAAMTIPLPGGRRVHVGDLGSVSDSSSDPLSIARVDGHEMVGFSVYRSQGFSEVTVSDEIAAHLTELHRQYPGIIFHTETDWVLPTREAYHSALFSLLEGSLLAILMVFIFLRRWQATMIAAIAIPLSIIPTFAVMQACGFSLNAISLLAISLVSGVLVDDAIVEIENIMRFGHEGSSPWNAAMLGSQRIGIAVIATTGVIIAVFLPVSMMPGIPGRYFVEFGVTVAVAVTFSLIVARLITPILCAYFLPASHLVHSPRKTLRDWYQRMVGWSLAHRKTTLICGVVWMALSVAMVPLLPTGFYITGDHSQATLQVEMPPGVNLFTADHIGDQIQALLKSQPEVRSVFAHIEVPLSNFTINMVPPNQRRVSIRQFEDRLRPLLASVPDQRSSFLDDRGSRDFSIQVLGNDREQLRTYSEELIKEMSATHLFTNINLTSGQTRSEITFRTKREQATRLGIDPSRLAHILQVATSGDDETSLAHVSIDNRLVPIRVQLARESRTLEEMASLRIPTAANGTVPLSSVADLLFRDRPASYERSQQTHSIGIESDLAHGATLGQGLEAVSHLPSWSALPPGLHILPGGDADSMDELFSGFSMAAVIGMISVYLILVLLYHDAFHPLTIMIAIPLSLGGAVLGLVLGAKPLDLSALIGFLMLMGIVLKNAILVVDEALQKRREGMERSDALIWASTVRARPVLMTTCAMIAGMLPVLFGLAPDAAFRSTMAVAVIGGLTSSTLLSLVFVPVFFTYIDDVRNRASTLAIRLISRHQASEPDSGPGPVL